MSHAPSDTLNRRIAPLRARLAEERLDALVVTAPPNITYLTNFTGSTAIAVATADQILFLTDSRYTTALADSQATAWACPSLELIVVDGAYDSTLAAVLAARGYARVGFEAAQITVSRHRTLEATLDRKQAGVELVATEGWVERQRVIKDEYENRGPPGRRPPAVRRRGAGPRRGTLGND